MKKYCMHIKNDGEENPLDSITQKKCGHPSALLTKLKLN